MLRALTEDQYFAFRTCGMQSLSIQEIQTEIFRVVMFIPQLTILLCNWIHPYSLAYSGNDVFVTAVVFVLHCFRVPCISASF